MSTENQTAEEIRAAAIAESERCSAIRAAFGGKAPTLEAEAIRAGWTVEAAQDALRAVEVETLRASRSAAPAVHASNRTYAHRGDVAKAALLMHLNANAVAEAHYNDATLQAARDCRATSLVECVAASWDEPTMGTLPRGREALLRASFSQALIGDLLSDSASKLAAAEYQRLPLLSTKLAKVVSVKDFKEAKALRLENVNSVFEELAETGEIRHGALADSSVPIRAKTYAKMFALTRQDIINDDLGALDSVPKILAMGAGMKLEELFWRLVMENTAGFFAESNGNLTDAVLGVEGLGAGVALMRRQVDREGLPILASPKYLVVGPTQEATADQLFASLNLVATGDTDRVLPSGNVFRNKYEPLCSPYLENASYANASSTAWYLFSDPAILPAVYVCYLDGKAQPTVESADVDFNKLGVQMRGYHDFGVAFGNVAGAVLSTGDAEGEE